MKLTKLLVIISLIGLILLSSCSTMSNLFKQPDVRFNNMAIQRINLSTIDLLFKFDVTNPNPLGITLTDYNYVLEVDQKNFLTGATPSQIAIPGNGRGILEVPASINFSDLYRAVSSIAGNDEAPYHIKGDVRVKTPIGPISVPFSKSGNFPLFKKPSIKLASLRLDDLGLLSANLVFDVQIDNPNILSLAITKLNHNFSLSGKPVLQTQTTERMQIAQKGKSNLSIPVKLNFVELGSAFKDVLTGGNVNYQLNGNMSLDLPGGVVDMPYNAGGAIPITR